MIKLIFLHGYESSGSGFKGTFFKRIFPYILTPTFSGDLQARMEQLHPIIDEKGPWTIIGSSFGGLMATQYASSNPSNVKNLILLAPALIPPFYPIDLKLNPIEIPTLIIHGKNDSVIPVATIQDISPKLFQTFEFRVVDDDHMLHQTVSDLDWNSLIA